MTTKPQPLSSSQKASPKVLSPLTEQCSTRIMFSPIAVQIEVYANPSRPTSAGVVKAIVDEFISRVEEGRMSGMTSMIAIDRQRSDRSTKCTSESPTISFKMWIQPKARPSQSRPIKKALMLLSSICSPTLRPAWH